MANSRLTDCTRTLDQSTQGHPGARTELFPGHKAKRRQVKGVLQEVNKSCLEKNSILRKGVKKTLRPLLLQAVGARDANHDPGGMDCPLFR